MRGETAGEEARARAGARSGVPAGEVNWPPRKHQSPRPKHNKLTLPGPFSSRAWARCAGSLAVGRGGSGERGMVVRGGRPVDRRQCKQKTDTAKTPGPAAAGLRPRPPRLPHSPMVEVVMDGMVVVVCSNVRSVGSVCLRGEWRGGLVRKKRAPPFKKKNAGEEAWTRACAGPVPGPAPAAPLPGLARAWPCRTEGGRPRLGCGCGAGSGVAAGANLGGPSERAAARNAERRPTRPTAGPRLSPPPRPGVWQMPERGCGAGRRARPRGRGGRAWGGRMEGARRAHLQ